MYNYVGFAMEAILQSLLAKWRWDQKYIHYDSSR